MALYTDGPAADVEYLRSYESGILAVAEAEGIDLSSKLALASDEVGDAILQFLLAEGTPEQQQRRRSTGLTDVAVTPALRRWQAVKALEHVYRDAYGHQLNERYEQKLREYVEASARAADEYFLIGAGLVAEPMPKAPAPVLVSAGAADITCYLRVSWVGPGGAEGAPSEAAAFTMGAGAVISSLEAPSGAAGWNVYGGTSPSTSVLQTETPVAAGITWTFNGMLATQGTVAGNGQKPDFFVAEHRILRRG